MVVYAKFLLMEIRYVQINSGKRRLIKIMLKSMRNKDGISFKKLNKEIEKLSKIMAFTAYTTKESINVFNLLVKSLEESIKS